jgi:hypothetical protein
MSYMELLIANVSVVMALYLIERVWLLKQETHQKIIYHNIENTKPENREILKSDIENLTGLQINRMEIGNINFSMGTAVINIYYYKQKQL